MGTEVPGQSAGGLVVAEDNLHDFSVVFLDVSQLRIPGDEWAEDDRVFEAFGPMDRDDLHGVLIAFQAQLVILRCRLVARASILEPLDQARWAQVLCFASGLQQLGHVEQVRYPTLAVGEAKQVLDHILLAQESREHEKEAVHFPAVPISSEPLQARLPLELARHQLLQSVSADPERVGRQGALDKVLATRRQDGCKDPLELARLRRFEDAFHSLLDAGDAQVVKGRLHPACLPVRFHQDGDVARLKVPVAKLVVAA